MAPLDAPSDTVTLAVMKWLALGVLLYIGVPVIVRWLRGRL